MNRPVARYRRSPLYGWLAVVATGGALLSAWLGLRAAYCFIPGVLFAATAVVLAWFATRPEIRVYDSHVAIGRKTIPWAEMTSVDATGWLVPLIVRITANEGPFRICYAGDRTTGADFLMCLRRMATSALIDGEPHRKYWGEILPSGKVAEVANVPLSRPRLLLPEDELEVEQMYRRLKTEGYLESHDRSSGARE